MGTSPIRATVMILAIAVAALAAAVALTGGTPSEFVASASASASGLPSTPPSLTPSLPAVAAAPPIVTPDPSPTAIVARRIRIERLGIDLPIVEGDGIDAPMHKAAHYPGTGWPNGGTNIYIYAHAQKGMFLALWDVKVDDEVVLDLVDGTSRRYIVTDVKPKVGWDAIAFLDPTPSEQLTLQTSTSYTPTAPRFLVIARPAT